MDYTKVIEHFLEFLKLSAGTFAALAGALLAFLLAATWGWIPPLDPQAIQWLTFGLTLTVALALLGTFKGVQPWLVGRVDDQREKRRLERYLPHMNEDERSVIAYLLDKNEKSFTATLDGGYAATLLARGVVKIIAKHGQHVHPDDVPMAIPDHLWDVLVANKEQFPYTPRLNNGTEVHPWRVSWMAR